MPAGPEGGAGCDTCGVSVALASPGRARNEAHLHAGHQGRTGHLPLCFLPQCVVQETPSQAPTPCARAHRSRVSHSSGTAGAGITPLHGPSRTCHGKLMVPKRQQMGTRNISSVQTITLLCLIKFSAPITYPKTICSFKKCLF